MTSRLRARPYSGTHSSAYDHSRDNSSTRPLSLLAGYDMNATDNRQTIDFDFGYSDDERESSAENLSSMSESDTQVVRQSQAITHSGFLSW